MAGLAAIRHAVPADVPVLRAIAAQAYQRYVPRIGRVPAPVEADYDAVVDRGEAYVAVGEAGILGLIVLVPEDGYLLLENVAVLPSAQGQGIGARLLGFADSTARDLGLPEVRLYTHETMTENQAYYARHGYVLTHRAEQDGYRRVFFTKLLS